MELTATETGLLASAEFLWITWHCFKDLALRHFRSGLSGRLMRRRILELCICSVSKSYYFSEVAFHTLTLGEFWFLMINVALDQGQNLNLELSTCF